MFTVNLIVADDVLSQTGMTQQQLDNVISGIEQAASLWSRYIDGNNAVIDIALDFADLAGSTLAEAGSSFFSQNGAPFQSEVITELNGQAGFLANDGTFTVDLPNILNDNFHFSDSLDFVENPGAPGQIDFLTLAAHELGHVLGFLGLAFEGFVENNQFIGANAVAANGGQPVQLADGVHTDGGDLLSPSISSNTREPLNEVLIAILQDIGVPIAQATDGADTLYGFNQNDDALNGEGGNDSLIGLSGDDTLFGLSGNDLLEGGEGADVINGGDGVDTASYLGSNEGITVFTNGRVGRDGDAQGDELLDVENIIGSDFGDQIILNTSTSENSTVNAGDGDDRIRSRDGGIDNLFGEDGDDNLFAGTSSGVLDGGNGEDKLFGGSGDNILIGGDDNSRDRLFGAGGNDELSGGGGNDSLRGNTGDDILNGGAGNDNLQGGNQNDTLNGGQDTDVLDGGSGNDTLNGGLGNDRLTGGLGNDLFVFEVGSGIDRIIDFNLGAGDSIDLSDFGLADFGTVIDIAIQAGDDVRINFESGETLVLNDTLIESLDASDFILI